jgi:hypothetical protein
MMFRALAVSLVWMFSPAMAQGQEADRAALAQRIIINAADDMATCASYFVLASEGVGALDPQLSADLEQYAYQAMALGLHLSERGGQMPEAFEASYQMTRRTMLRRINHDFTNMAILSNDYLEMCGEALRNPVSRMKYWGSRLLPE